MNPDTKKTMKHDNLLSKSSRVNFKRVITRSSSKLSNSITDSSVEGKDNSGELELGCGMDDNGSNVDAGESGREFKSVGKESNVTDFDNMVNNQAYDSVNSMNTCNLDSNINVIPEMPVPISGNPNLSHKPNENKSPNKVSVGEVKEPVMFKVNGDSSDIAEGVGSVRNFEVGETSRGENVVGREVSDRDPGYCWSFGKDVQGVSVGRGDKSKSYVFFYFKSDDGMENVSQRVYQMVPG
ncbi:hypothetical protein Tco_0980751 [Tanacetum coccineum]